MAQDSPGKKNNPEIYVPVRVEPGGPSFIELSRYKVYYYDEIGVLDCVYVWAGDELEAYTESLHAIQKVKRSMRRLLGYET